MKTLILKLSINTDVKTLTNTLKNSLLYGPLMVDKTLTNPNK